MVSVIVSLTESTLTGMWASGHSLGRAACCWWCHSPGWWRKGALFPDCECSLTGYFVFLLPSPLSIRTEPCELFIHT